MVIALLERVVERRPMGDHDGRSGATLERVVLEDGRRLVVKTVLAAHDITCAVDPDAVDRELRLHESGVLDRLPPGVGHTVVGGSRSPGGVVLVMEDVGDAVITWDSRLDVGSCNEIVRAMAAMHARFGGAPIDGLVSLERWLTFFAPATMCSIPIDYPLRALVLRGWEHFRSVAPPAVAAAVADVHRDPRRLAAALRSGGATLTHGDLWPVNAALTDRGVLLLDWALATAAPGALDLATFVAGASSLTQLSRDDLVAEYCTASGCDEATMSRALVAALCAYGWNKALDVAEHPDATKRDAESADLSWWITAAELALAERPW